MNEANIKATAVTQVLLNAWRITRPINKPGKKQANKILLSLTDALLSLDLADLAKLPPIEAHESDETDEIYLEWCFPDRRLVFVFRPHLIHFSSWVFVSKTHFGDCDSGYVEDLKEGEIQHLVGRAINFKGEQT